MRLTLQPHHAGLSTASTALEREDPVILTNGRIEPIHAGAHVRPAV
jgi:hypothetical protein